MTSVIFSNNKGSLCKTKHLYYCCQINNKLYLKKKKKQIHDFFAVSHNKLTFSFYSSENLLKINDKSMNSPDTMSHKMYTSPTQSGHGSLFKSIVFPAKGIHEIFSSGNNFHSSKSLSFNVPLSDLIHSSITIIECKYS